MDFQNPDAKNVLMELESLKSQQCIFKMKEANYIKDKEILEDSIKTLQTDLQDKSEVVRALRKDLDFQSSNLYRDILMKNEELEKSVLENNDLTKKLTIALETIDHHVKRNESLKLEFDKQKKNYDRESDYKTRLVGFFETSSNQKDAKISALTYDLNSIKSKLSDMESQLEGQKQTNVNLENNLQQMQHNFTEERHEREQELLRAKNEIVQLQQDGISELHLEKMNPTVAATIKALKSAKSLMDVYSELHSVISDRDYLQLEKSRLIKGKEELETSLKVTEREVELLRSESSESLKVTDNLKSRLLCLVSDLRSSETKKGKMEREVLLAKRKLEISEKEVSRLMEQVRVLLVAGDNSESIKQEPVDVDNAMYSSVQELQEVNRVLRNDNDALRSRLDESDSEQFKQRCNELQVYSDSLNTKVEHLSHDNTSCKNLLVIHEKQVKMLRYLIELKSPGSNSAIDKALKSLDEGMKNNVEVAGDCEVMEEQRPIENEPEVVDEADRISKLEGDISEMMDNKRASDQVYIKSMESIRAQLVIKTKLAIDLAGKLEELEEQFKEERENNEKYRKESELLRAINKNLSQNSAVLESQIEDFKLKLECKISQLAEKKAELDACKTQVASCRSQQNRLLYERDELKKTLHNQDAILTNISSLQNAANLKDHLCLSNMQYKAQKWENTVTIMHAELDDKNAELSAVRDELRRSEIELNDCLAQLNESKALADAYNVNAVVATESFDAECQGSMKTHVLLTDSTQLVSLLSVYESSKEEMETTPITDPSMDIRMTEYTNTIVSLEDQLREMQEIQQSSNEKLENYSRDISEINQKCEFYESQLNILEKAKQEVLNENIKLTEEAHDLNASLKQDLHRYQDELSRMKIRLEEAENVERTAQSVIDKYVKECNEAKAKYKRELTLHANDSKSLELLNREIATLQSKEDDSEERCKRLRAELQFCEEKCAQQLSDVRAQMSEIEEQLREAESRNDRLFGQLTQISGDGDNVILNEIIEDLRSQIKIGKLSGSLLSIEKEKYDNELERLRNEVCDLQSQLCMEKDKLNLSNSEIESLSSNVDTEIVIESNHTLREQKSGLDRLVLNQRTQIDEFVQLIGRLQTGISDSEAQNNALVLVKAELEDERNRWKERCTKLIERAEQLDPEKYRVACNDRDRFEKQLCERETNLSEVQTELINAKEKMVNLFNTIEEEKNKLKKEEAIGLQLKEIARKYKNESEKRKQQMTELESLQIELENEKEELMQEKEETISRLKDVESDLESRCNLWIKEKEDMIVNLKATQSEFDFRLEVLQKEKYDAISRLNEVEMDLDSRINNLLQERDEGVSKLVAVESELDSLTKLCDDLTCRCELLDQDDKEKSMKLQLIESTMARLKEENKSLKTTATETSTKRGIDEVLEDEPQTKRMKIVTEEESPKVENNAAAEERSGNVADSIKIWWNVSNNPDEEHISIIHDNLAQYQAIEDEYERNEVKMHDEDNIESGSEEESLESHGQENLEQYHVGQDECDRHTVEMHDEDVSESGSEVEFTESYGSENLEQYHAGQDKYDRNIIEIHSENISERGSEEESTGSRVQKNVDQCNVGQDEYDMHTVEMHDEDVSESGSEEESRESRVQENVEQNQTGQIAYEGKKVESISENRNDEDRSNSGTVDATKNCQAFENENVNQQVFPEDQKEGYLVIDDDMERLYQVMKEGFNYRDEDEISYDKGMEEETEEEHKDLMEGMSTQDFENRNINEQYIEESNEPVQGLNLINENIQSEKGFNENDPIEEEELDDEEDYQEEEVNYIYTDVVIGDRDINYYDCAEFENEQDINVGKDDINERNGEFTKGLEDTNEEMENINEGIEDISEIYEEVKDEKEEKEEISERKEEECDNRMEISVDDDKVEDEDYEEVESEDDSIEEEEEEEEDSDSSVVIINDSSDEEKEVTRPQPGIVTIDLNSSDEIETTTTTGGNTHQVTQSTPTQLPNRFTVNEDNSMANSQRGRVRKLIRRGGN